MKTLEHAAAAFWLAGALSLPAASGSPYNALLGWDAATEFGVDAAWEPHLNPLAGPQVWTWDMNNAVSFRAMTNAATPGLSAAFSFDGEDVATLAPGSPESIPLNPTDYSVGLEFWFRPAGLDAGRQVIFSFGGKTDGASLTLENDLLRFQFRDSDVRAGIDTDSPSDGTNDDGLEDLVASVKTRLTSTNDFVHVVAAIELGGTNPQVALYLNGALAPPLDDPETGLFKDESLVTVGNSFAQVAGTQGLNPLPLRTLTDPPVAEWVSPTDWSGTRAGRLGRRDGDVGGTSDPSSGPLYLNDFNSTTFQGEIAIFNLYLRALNERQVAALHEHVTRDGTIPPTSHTTQGLVLNYDARVGTLSGGADWEDTTLHKPAFANNGIDKLPSDAWDWKFGVSDNSNVIASNVSRYTGLTSAYVFTSASTADDGKLAARRSDGVLEDSLSELVSGNLDQGNGSFELWIKPSDLAGQEVLLESGGSIDGMALRLNEDRLELVVRHGNNSDPASQQGSVSASLSGSDLSDFSQVVGVIDLTGDQLRLYVNGTPVGVSAFAGEDWDGGDPAALGGIGGNLGGGQDSGFGGFDGQIALLRIYNRALSEAEILDNFDAIAPGMATNRAPTDLRLAHDSVAENQPTGTTVGTLIASDANTGDTHTFALVNGEGDADNDSFNILGSLLTTAAAFDYETRSQYSVRVRAIDQGGLHFEKALTVMVDNLNEADPRAAVPPNIIIYMCDDMGMGEAHPYFGKRLGPNAAPISKTLVTPNLDRLAAMGTLFTDVHTASSMCSPSRYALLTGRYAWRTYNKHTVIGGWQSRPMIAPNRPTLATLLGQYGYRTAAFGKWHLGWTLLTASGLPMTYDSATEATWATVRLGPSRGGGYVTNILDGPLAHGFEYFFGVSGNFANKSAGLLKAYIENNTIQGIPTWGGAPPQAGQDCVGPGVADWDQQRLGESYMNRALDYIDSHVFQDRHAPFFFYYVPNANHGPTDPATNIVVQGRTIAIKGQSSYTDGSGGGNRTDMIYENDVAIGLLLDKLADFNDPRTGQPMINSTLFIFTSDNGPDAFGVGQAGLRDKKTALYEGGHRVPFIVSWPDGGIPGGAVNTANFGQFDLYASFADLLGHELGVDEAEDSANVLPALLNQVSGAQFRRAHSLVSHDDSLANNGLPDDSALAIRDHPMVLLIDGNLVNRNQTAGPDRGTASPIKLFDLKADLHQDIDLLGQTNQAATVADLAERLLLFHNRGFSRELGLTEPGQLLHTDGGADLRNDVAGAIGYEFRTGDEPVVVESLGLWDDGAEDTAGNELDTLGDGQTAGAPDGLATPHIVRLFESSSQALLADVTVSNENSYLVGEFRYVDLPEPIMLRAGMTYALTMSTASGDDDLFHHFASFTGVSPSPSSLVSNFVARFTAVEGAYPGDYPDGADGAGNRHPDMFRHRMFVGPNARLARFRITSTVTHGANLVLTFPAGAGITYRLDSTVSLAPPDWRPEQTGIVGRNGLLTVVVPVETEGSQRFFRLANEN